MDNRALKVKLSLYLIKQHAMKVYERVEEAPAKPGIRCQLQFPVASLAKKELSMSTG
jgi:hypothetical protein